MASTFKPSKPSFQRKVPSKVCKLSGTKASIHNSQLLISSGVPSLDALIGGGIPLGTVLLIEEDVYANFANILFRYFLAEGVTSDQRLFLASLNSDPARLLKMLPKPLVLDGGGLKAGKSSALDLDSLKIAFQYKNLPAFRSRVDVSQFGHYYDLSETMDQDSVKKAQPRTFPATDCDSERCLYDQLLGSIYAAVQEGNFSTGAPLKEDSSVLRIGLQSLHSPLWSAERDEDAVHFCRFLYELRALVRYSLATCVITVPAHLLEDATTVKRIERMCDIVLRLESFSGSDRETNPVFKDYQGLFHVVKLPSLNSLTCYRPTATDFGFKLRRRKFVIETLHLPPELPETTNRRQEDERLFPARSLGCGQSTSGRSKLDF